MKHFVFTLVLACLAALTLAVPMNGTEIAVEEWEWDADDADAEVGLVSRAIKGPKDGHLFTIVNKCKHAVLPRVADTRCGYSPRCKGAAKYSGKQPAKLGAGKKVQFYINRNWVGRIYNKIKRCGPKGENCTMAEFNLDTGSKWSPQAYDISNIQGFTQSMAISAKNCASVTCKTVKCPCKQAYKPGDMSGCGNDSPVRACGTGRVPFKVVFCP